MFRWIKLGRVFDPTTVTGVPWLTEFAQAPATLVFDRFVRVYFSCRPARDANGQYVSFTGYLDLNRNNLLEVVRLGSQPILSLGGTGTFDEFGTYPASVIRRDDASVAAYYGGWTRCESVPFDVAIGMALSQDDGVTFERAGTGPILGRSLDEPFIISGPKVRRFNGEWQLWYIAGKTWLANEGKPEPVYRIRMAVSRDGLSWRRHGIDLIPPRVEDNECQASPDVFKAGDTYHMFFCYRYSLGYRGRQRGYRIGYASSRDMIRWVRDDARAGLDVSAEGWDSEMVSYPHVFEVDGQVFMLYLGDEVGRYGFGLARLDGRLG